MHKLTSVGIAVIGWGLMIVGLAACGSASTTQVPTQPPAPQTSVSASPQASSASTTQVPTQPPAPQTSVSASPQASSVSTTQVPTQPPPSQAAFPASPPVNIDPCMVLTQNDATALFGAPSNAGLPSSGGLPAFCIYATTDNTSSLSVNLSYEASGARNAEEFVALKSLNQDVPGLGDAAFFDSTLGFLTVAKGPWNMRLSGTIKGVKAPLDKLKSLAQTALGRLP
jgi:hypothetical protein